MPSTSKKLLEHFVRSNDLTEAIVIQGLFSALLGRISRLNEVTIGLVRSGRSSPLPNIDNAIGLFISTLPVYSNLSKFNTLKELLIANQQEQVNQDVYSHIGLNEIQNAIGMSGQPLFETLLVFENYPVKPHSGDLGKLSQTNSEGQDGTHYPLALIVTPSDLEFELRLNYDLSRLDEHGAKQVLQILSAWITDIETLAKKSIMEFPLVNIETKDAYIHCAQGSQVPTADHETLKTLLESFDAQCETRPALVFENETLNYTELHQASNQLARELISQGIGPESVVGIMLDRSPQCIIAILAVIKSGAAYLPLDPDYPAPRLSYMLQNSRASCLIASRYLVDSLLTELNASAEVVQSLNYIDLAPNIIFLDDKETITKIHQYKNTNISNDEMLGVLLPDNLAYVIYTSGSTGEPKGVAMTHLGLVNLMNWHQNLISSPAQRIVQYSPISFDVSAQEIFFSLCYGHTLVLVSDETRRDSHELLSYLEKQSIDAIFLPFVALNSLSESEQASENTFWPEYVITAGEQLQITPNIRKTFERHPLSELHNHYGPTESHVVSEIRLEDNRQLWNNLPSIGRPIFNTNLYILDKNLELVPDGIPGELFISGDCLARSYIHKPGLTAERFIACPFLKGGRMYRTGDLVRKNDDGAIQFLGRIDQQIKIRGYRIEPGEIETRILDTFELVAQAAVIPTTINGEVKLSAYIASPSGAETLSQLDMKTHLSQLLPDYMIPSFFIYLDHLPLTPNGKLDRRNLPSPALIASTNYEIPKSRKEALICQFYSEVLGINGLGSEDNFFTHGGHSLLAMRLCNMIKTRLGCSLPLRKIFEYPTPESLTPFVDVNIQWEYDPLLPLNTLGKQIPIFCVHPGGGYGTVYKNLASAMGSDYPVWAFQAKGFEKNEVPHHSVGDMAIEYVKAMQKVQKTGPYRLLGWSFGGTIAQTMATILEESGEQVELLCMLDTLANLPDATDTQVAERDQHLEILTELARTYEIEDDNVSVNNVDFLQLLLDKVSEDGLIPPTTTIDSFKMTISQMIRASQMTREHKKSICKANILLVRAASEPTPKNGDCFAWKQFTTAEFIQAEVPYKHSQLWAKEPSSEIASIIKEYLAHIKETQSIS
jgi:amino acid adenylation domain-containing protein